MRRAVVLTLLLCLVAPAAPGAKTCRPEEKPLATVIVLWGPEGVEQHCSWFASRGYRAKILPEVPPNWKAAWREMRRFARESPKPRYAYGWSRAGTIAELMAFRGLVEGAISVGAPSDLTRWWNEYPEYWENEGLTMEERRERSPLYNVPPDPVDLLLAHSPDDQAVPYWHSRRLHRRTRGSELVTLHGNHNDDTAGVRRASLRFLRAAVRTQDQGTRR